MGQMDRSGLDEYSNRLGDQLKEHTMEGDSKTAFLFRLIAPLGFLFLVLYFYVRCRSIDYTAFAYSYVDLAPIYIGVYGVFLAFISAGVIFPPKDASTSSRLVCWAIAVVQVWAIVGTSEAFVQLKAALGSPVIDVFEITTHTGTIFMAFEVAIMSFLFGITVYTVGGPGRFYELFMSRRRSRGVDLGAKRIADEDQE